MKQDIQKQPEDEKKLPLLESEDKQYADLMSLEDEKEDGLEDESKTVK